MGAYVSLLEYNNIEGMILLSELSRRRIRSVNKLIKVCSSSCSGLLYTYGFMQQFLMLTAVADAVGRSARASDGAACGQGEGLHRSLQEVRCSVITSAALLSSARLWGLLGARKLRCCQV